MRCSTFGLVLARLSAATDHTTHPMDACESSADDEQHEVLLLQVESPHVRRGVRSEASSVAAAAVDHKPARADQDRPVEAGWFGSFQEGESTWSVDGVSAHLDQNTERLAQEGFDPGMATRSHVRSTRPQEFFHESPSAGDTEAYQSHFPPVDGSTAGNRHIRDNPWRYTPGGWVQDYIPVTASGRPGPQPANWFDSRAEQYDGFGRYMMPTRNSPLWHLDWEERSVNTTLECEDPGCTARSLLQAFDGLTEQGTNCRLSIVVHPTDFDEEHSTERVDLLSANGHVLSQDCNPGVRGCNETASRGLYSCLNSFPVDTIIDEMGSLVLEGRITPLVDECPHEGNLLAARAMVTCLVSPIPETTTTTTEDPDPLDAPNVNATALLRCLEPGCEAHADLFFNPFFAEMGGTCLLRVDVNQTDFDGAHGQNEVIQFLQVEGVNISEDISPGHTPCVAEYEGNPTAEEDRVFNIVDEYDVTDAVLDVDIPGRLRVTGKISDDVDECGTPWLLDGLVSISCSPPPPEDEDGGDDDEASLLATSKGRRRPRARVHRAH